MHHKNAMGLAGLAALAIVAAAPVAALASEDEASPDPGLGSDSDASAAPQAAADSGTATLTIGEGSWFFSNIFCAFTPEEAGNERVSFTLSASGSFGDLSAQLSVDIQDSEEQGRYEGEGTIQSVSINDIEDFEDPAVSLEAITGFVGAPEWTIQVDGKNISAEAPFDDGTTDAIETTPGSLVATCF